MKVCPMSLVQQNLSNSILLAFTNDVKHIIIICIIM